MPTTSNFGWTTPADTDLVKDGAAAIRTLANGIDTSFLDLKGGTTNQVLAKNSNTDLDFKWVADATGIPATIFDAKGDLIAATAADTADRLAVGTNGQVLTADSTTATGLKWATASSGGMTSIASGTLSGSSLSITSISGTYNDLILRLTAVDLNTDDKTIKMTLNSDTGATQYVRGLAFNGTLTSAGGNPDLTILTGSDNTVLTNYVEVRLPSYANTSTYQCINIQSFGADPTTTTSLVYVNNAIGIYRDNAAITSIQIFPADSTTFDGGSYVLYGVK